MPVNVLNSSSIRDVSGLIDSILIVFLMAPADR